MTISRIPAASNEAGAPEIEITPAMVEAGFKVLRDSCIVEHLLQGDVFIISEVFSAMIAASSSAFAASPAASAARPRARKKPRSP
jgi:hypothetical protein